MNQKRGSTLNEIYFLERQLKRLDIPGITSAGSRKRNKSDKQNFLKNGGTVMKIQEKNIFDKQNVFGQGAANTAFARILPETPI